jgi:hypothetical protein
VPSASSTTPVKTSRRAAPAMTRLVRQRGQSVLGFEGTRTRTRCDGRARRRPAPAAPCSGRSGTRP